ncbi:hypothetical protein ACTXT7_005008 [Hymenolepis weldensis]
MIADIAAATRTFLSDKIAFRVLGASWCEKPHSNALLTVFPGTADRYVHWIGADEYRIPDLKLQVDTLIATPLEYL